MTHLQPVRNTFYFLQPTAVHNWLPAEVPGVIGVLRRTKEGDFEVIDAFPVDSVPSSRDLTSDARFSYWYALAGSVDQLRFDVFSMPTSASEQRNNVVTLLARTCGFDSVTEHLYAHAM